MAADLKKIPRVSIIEIDVSPRASLSPPTINETSQQPHCSPPKSAFYWSLQKKWIVTLLSIMATFTTMLNGTIITVAHEFIDAQFSLSNDIIPQSYWLVSSWTLGGAISSLIVLPLLEDFGIRSGFLATYIAFISTMIPQALVSNFAGLLVLRFLTGCCVSILANAAGSVIGNVWETERARTLPMSLWITCYLMSISVGPVVGAAVLESMNWHWLFHAQSIFHCAIFPLYWFFFAESRASAILERLQENDSKLSTLPKECVASMLTKIWCSVKRPLYMLFTEPVLFAFTLWSSFAIGLVYLFTQSVEQVYSELHGWSPIQAGYIQVAVVIGTLLGWSGTVLSSHVYFRSIPRNKEKPGSPIPEARLYISVLGSVLGIAAGMFVYGWTARPGIPWIWSAIGLAMVGFGTVVVVTAAADYVVDSYASHAGSAIAAVVLGENLVAAFLPMASEKMYTNLGFQWASTTLGFASLLLSLAPVVLIVWGPTIRAASPFTRESCAQGKFLGDDASQGPLSV